MRTNTGFPNGMLVGEVRLLATGDDMIVIEGYTGIGNTTR